MAVNEKVAKSYDPFFEPSVEKEYELPWNSAVFQANGFCESSVIIHLYQNWKTHVEPYEFVGFLHYDMKISNNTLDHINEKLYVDHKDDKDILFYFDKEPGSIQFGSSFVNLSTMTEECLCHQGWMKILDAYNKFFNTNHDYYIVSYEDLPLFHTFLIHKSLFAKIVPFVLDVMPSIVEYLTKTNMRHLPYTMETLWGMMLMLHKRENQNMKFIKFTDFVHDDAIKDDWKPSIA